MNIGALPSSTTSTTSTAAASGTPAVRRAAAPAEQGLSPEALAQLEKLKARDLEVRQHEMAHLSAAGGLATSGPSYTYQRGPNGVNYAIGGEVNIDTSPGATPEESISRARAIQAAALAPADPSGADVAVAAQARQMEQQARAEQQQQSETVQPATPQTAVERAYGSAAAAASTVDLYA